jgi:Collagen triple helix repeat (20 copies)
MLSWVRRRVTWANIGVTLVLVFAMTGGAYAAKKYLITSTKQISPKVLKALKGKAGPAGKTGLAGAPGAPGPAGPVGPEGKAGVNGKDGTNGTNGVPGEPGKSVKSFLLEGSKEPAGEPCKKAGGAEFEVEGSSAKPTYACNGGTGSGGGWPETLPPEKTETGTWSVEDKTYLPNSGERVETAISISFPIPLPEPTEHAKAARIEYVKVTLNAKFEPEPTGNANCPGFEPTPQAAKGYLCIYSNSNASLPEENVENVLYHNPEAGLVGFSEHYASRTGVSLFFESTEAPAAGVRLQMKAEGAWAVTAA